LTQPIGKKFRSLSVELIVALSITGVVFLSFVYVTSVYREIENSVTRFAVFGGKAFRGLQRELGYTKPFGIEASLENLEERFGIKYEYRAAFADLSDCIVQRQIEKTTVCIKSFDRYFVIKRLDTLQGKVFFVFSKEIDYTKTVKYLKVIGLFILFFFFFVFLYLQKIFSSILRPLKKLHAHIESEKDLVDGSLGIKEYDDILQVISASRHTLEIRLLNHIGEKINHDILKPFAQLKTVVGRLVSMEDYEKRNLYIANVMPQVEKSFHFVERTLANYSDLSLEEGLKKELCKLDDLLDDATKLLGLTNVGRFYEKNTIFLDLDKDKMLRALVNILDNAEKNKFEKMWIKTKRKRSHVEVIIGNDNDGRKISEATKATMFDLFATTKKDGRGIGLAVAKQFVEKHGGSVFLSKNEPRKIEFTIEIPF
jgi:signal transduction histidine kinase